MNAASDARARRDDQEVAGLAGERTDLAWSCSGLGGLVCVRGHREADRARAFDARRSRDRGVALVVGGLAWGFALLWARSIAGTTLTGRRIADPRKSCGSSRTGPPRSAERRPSWRSFPAADDQSGGAAFMISSA